MLHFRGVAVALQLQDLTADSWQQVALEQEQQLLADLMLARISLLQRTCLIADRIVNALQIHQHRLTHVNILFLEERTLHAVQQGADFRCPSKELSFSI